MMGITSSMSYMRLAILQIKRRYNAKYYSDNGYTAYDFYRYHYSSFCHAIATIHDLYFKLVVELCDFNIGSKRMIQWDKLRDALNSNDENDILELLEHYYSVIQEHEQKRNMFSHEGLLYSKMLDNYHLTNIWSRHHKKTITADDRAEYIEGTKEEFLMIRTIATILAVLTAAEFFYIFYLETLVPTSKKTSEVFKIPQDTLRQDTVKTLLKNQGVYNGLLGVLILLAVFCFASLAMTAVLMVYIILVAAYGAVSSQPRILLMQGGLPILTLIFLLLTLA